MFNCLVKVAPNGVSGSHSSQRYRIGFQAQSTFDAVELGYTRGAATGPYELRVHEFRSD